MEVRQMAEKDTLEGFGEGAADESEQDDAAANDADERDDDLSDGDPGDTSDDADADDDPVAELREQLTESRSEIASIRSQLESDRRQIGQVKSIQRQLTKLEAALTAPNPQLGRVSAAVDALVESLADDLTPAAKARLDTLRSEGQTQAAVAEALRQAGVQASDSDDDADDGDDAAPASQVEWQAAQASVLGYAEARGVDAAELMRLVPQTDWQAEMHRGPAGAAAAIKRRLDAKVKEREGGKRRTGKKAAAEQGKSPAKSGAGAAKITLAQIKGMSLEQVQAIPREERARILAGKNG
jgi:hypothetical protein